MIFITVTRNFKMYNDLVKNNIYNQGADFVCYDNNLENLGIPKRYNHFLDNYDYKNEDWLIFCHEDWQVQKAWLHHFKKLDKDSVYGPCGTICVIGTGKNESIKRCLLGEIKQSHKDGSGQIKLGIHVRTGTVVETHDCMCIILHSSLIKKYNIRFDENLDWHFYVEELNIRLNEEYGIKSKTLQMHCQHWSYGANMPNEDFDVAFNYVTRKFLNATNLYGNSIIDKYVGKTNMPTLEYEKLSSYVNNTFLYKFKQSIFQLKVSKSGRIQIKIFNITVLSLRIRGRKNLCD